MQKRIVSDTVEKTLAIGSLIGAQLRGDEVVELQSDLGGGKTTLSKGIICGFGISDAAASPSFTISYAYQRADGMQLHHFDLYRLANDPGIIGDELAEACTDPRSVVLIEWGGMVGDVLPAERAVITLRPLSEAQREIRFHYPKSLQYLFESIEAVY